MAMIVERQTNRFVKSDPQHLYVWEMIYDLTGRYVGQQQEDAIEGGLLYFPAQIIDGKPCVDRTPVEPLTEEEMRNAR